MDIIDYLIKIGLDPTSIIGSNLMSSAATRGHLELAKWILSVDSQAVTVTLLPQPRGASPLMTSAVCSGNIALVDWFARLGCSVRTTVKTEKFDARNIRRNNFRRARGHGSVSSVHQTTTRINFRLKKSSTRPPRRIFLASNISVFTVGFR
jgi:hypothetical protein